MGRSLRPLAPGLTYHVAARGNNGENIYAAVADRRRFLRMLGRIATRRKWSVTSFCLMDNHFHLLLTTANADLSDGMRELLAGYARFFNVKYERTGHLFSQRYLCVVVESDRQLMVASRYIARNPVRAGLRRRAQDWDWSSHALLARGAGLPDWCDCSILLAQFHLDRERSLELFLDFVDDDRLDVPGVAPPEAVSPVARRVPSIAALRLVMPLNEVIAAASNLGYPHKEIAEALGLSAAAVSQRAYRRRAGRGRDGISGSSRWAPR